MRFRLSTARRFFNLALAVLVAAALSHCSWQESRELAQWTQALAQHRLALPSPVQAPVHDCDHEYGCICRGATIVHALDVTHCQATCGQLLPIDFDMAAAFSASDDSAAVWSSALDHDSSVPPLSGRQLRARYASLVI
jgi:hypothetical protein